MKDGPNISEIASLIGDPARANMLTALMDGRALTASELASQAGITRQTASTHMAKLADGDLLVREVQGRHHYFRLSGEDVAEALEVLMGVAAKRSGVRTRTGPNDQALRKARRCYDHLAGEMAVQMLDKMVSNGWLDQTSDNLALTGKGRAALYVLGVDVDGMATSRRPFAKLCLDWSMRRPHLAGRLGQVILTQILANGWARTDKKSRVVSFTPQGKKDISSGYPERYARRAHNWPV